ncbi:hypothetical protein FSP39_010319 [Pinctada imbricata]|uniref:G-protein coupled receptors family 2 profile 2 domain-containing protein n=1 Tax=Pinctada imbricata TaxID=66713 RepID=A0AA88Y069_PINIB|nr:hypothetical protein FSP39_010319 [Pinctada imbricata]
MDMLNMTFLLNMSGEDKSYIGLTVLTSLLSLVSSIVVILSYITLKDKRTLGRKILMYISICNFGSCIGTIIAAGNVSHFGEASWRSFPTCEAAGAITIVCNMGGYAWTSVLTMYLYLSICWRREVGKSIMWPAHVVCWGFPVAIMVTAVLSEAVGFDLGRNPSQHRPPYCFIDAQGTEYFRWKLLAGISWRMAGIVICSIGYILIQIYVIRKTRPPINEDDPEDRRNEAELAQAKKEEYEDKANRQLRHVLIIFVLINVWATWRFFVDTMRASVDAIIIMEAIGDNIQGFTNFLILCVFTKDVRKALRISCCTFCCKLRCKCGRKTEIPLPLELEKLRPDEDQTVLLQGLNDEEEDIHFRKSSEDNC